MVVVTVYPSGVELAVVVRVIVVRVVVGVVI